MKKITLIVIILFFAAVGFLYIGGLLFYAPNNMTYDIKPPIFQNATSTASTTNNSNDAAALTLNEVAQHNNASSCYLTINNNVYDVSSYIDLHPGGRRQITSRCGTEVTGIFAQIHSNRAWDLLAKYKIAVLAQNNINLSTTAPNDLQKLKSGLQQANPDAEIVNIKPKNNFYIAKIIYQNKLYEVHIDEKGNIMQEEVADNEFDWSAWDSDKDDQ